MVNMDDLAKESLKCRENTVELFSSGYSRDRRKCLLVRCPDFRGCKVHKQESLGEPMCPIIEVFSIQGVLIRGVHCNGFLTS